MKDEYLSIAEFAKRAGVTRQAVYKKLTTELSDYVNEVDNKKVINSKALRLFGVEPVDSELTHTFTDLATYFDKQLDAFSHLVDVLEDDLAANRRELEIKNKQIEDLSRRADQSQVLLSQQQQLNAHALLSGSQTADTEAIEQKYRDQFNDEMQRIAKLLYEKYPEAVDYLITELEKKHL